MPWATVTEAMSLSRRLWWRCGGPETWSVPGHRTLLSVLTSAGEQLVTSDLPRKKFYMTKKDSET